MTGISEKSIKMQKRLRIWSTAAVFLFFFVFFTRIHPIVIFDTDDWAYIHHVRKAVPMLSIWNPAKVFPETFLPLCANIAVTLFMPVVKDYILSLTVGLAITVSIFIALYFYSFLNLVQKRLNLSAFESICILVLFVLFHFLVFRAENSGNDYMFCTTDANCYFNYIIPALLNCTLVMWIWTKDITADFLSPQCIPEKAVFVLAAYLAVFSNLYQSIILAVFCAVGILDSLFRKEYSGSGFLGFLKGSCAKIAVVVMWFAAAILELAGGRSRNLGKNGGGFAEELSSTADSIVKGFAKFNTFFVLLFALLAVAFVLFLIFRHRDTQSDEFKICMRFVPESILSAVIIYVFLILVCAKSGPERIAHCDVLFGFLFFIFIFMLSVISFCVRRYKLTGVLLPLLIMLSFFETFTQGRTFRESNQWDIDAKTCIAVSQDVVSQIVEADKEGLTETEVTLLAGKTEYDFPHSVQFAWVIPDALYRHGIISREIEIIPVQSEDYNLSFGIEPHIGE